MAVTVTNALDVPYRIVGNQKETVFDVTFDASYQNGGEPLTVEALGLNYMERATCTIQKVAGTVNVANATYEESEGKIHLFDETPAEVASEANVNGVVVRVVARGH
jgi:hypothetical protein